MQVDRIGWQCIVLLMGCCDFASLVSDVWTNMLQCVSAGMLCMTVHILCAVIYVAAVCVQMWMVVWVLWFMCVSVDVRFVTGEDMCMCMFLSG